jgi:hypothetical protein
MLLSATIGAPTDVLRQPGLTVHEWGTFTTVAAADGSSAQWLPLGGPNDLPCFVNVYKNIRYKVLVGSTSSFPELDYSQARTSLLGSVRMETPVLYFYSPKAMTARVQVAFPKGFITEWYPPANVRQAIVRTDSLQRPRTGATIEWKNFEILAPAGNHSFKQGASSSHYYAARATDANAVRVEGINEKFLFYRGVGGFPVPINVTVTSDGRIRLNHLKGKPSVILFENHAGKIGYSVVDTTANEVILSRPPLHADFESLRTELMSVLVGQGLYEKEARSMIETWRDSWFEEGTRVFYITPQQMVDAILPLTVEPKPAGVARVFVGRVEVITPDTIGTVQQAIQSNDTKTLEAYGRFLGPIADRLPESKQKTSMLDAALAARLRDAGTGGCRN